MVLACHGLGLQRRIEYVTWLHYKSFAAAALVRLKFYSTTEYALVKGRGARPFINGSKKTLEMNPFAHLLIVVASGDRTDWQSGTIGNTTGRRSESGCLLVVY